MIQKRHASPGSSPGTLVIESGLSKPVIRLMSYSAEALDEIIINDPDDLRKYLLRDGVTWIDIQGYGDEALLLKIRDIFNLHPLALSDAVNTPQRCKVEEYEKQLFIISKGVLKDEYGHLVIEQVSAFIGRNYLLTFTEHGGNTFEPVRERIRKGKGSIRKSGVDYLGYALLDVLIDGFYPVLETLGETLEQLEDEVILRPDSHSIQQIHRIKRDLLTLRRAIWPQRESINELLREANQYMTDKTRLYLRDCYDHVIQIMDVVETYRDIVSSLTDVYLSSVSNRMNEVIKVLTIIGTIFLPLTFIAGIYGMNFKNFPELEWRYGYLFFWLLTLITVAGMLFYFRRLGWIGNLHGKQKRRKRNSK